MLKDFFSHGRNFFQEAVPLGDRGPGRRIAEAIKASGLTVGEAAAKANAGPTAVYDYIKGAQSPRLDFIFRLAEITNVSAEWLIFGKEKSGGPESEADHELNPEERELVREWRQLVSRGRLHTRMALRHLLTVTAHAREGEEIDHGKR